MVKLVEQQKGETCNKGLDDDQETDSGSDVTGVNLITTKHLRFKCHSVFLSGLVTGTPAGVAALGCPPARRGDERRDPS